MIEKDFDFEANLAMFDKNREMQEIEAELTNKPDIVRLVHSNVRQPEPKYRNDENILGSKLSPSPYILNSWLSWQEPQRRSTGRS